MEYILNPVLLSPWCVVGWCVCGLLVGFTADLAYRFLPGALSKCKRAILTGMIMSLGNFLFFLIPLSFLYRSIPVANPAHPTFLGVAYYALPWLLLNSGFGGYTAWAIARNKTKDSLIQQQ